MSDLVEDRSTLRDRAGGRWQRWRVLVAVLALATGAAVLGVATLPETGAGELDPGSPEPAGARALAQVLGRQGVRVERVTRVSEAVTALSERPGGTLVVVHPDVLDPDLLGTLAEGPAQLVLVEPDAATLLAVDVPIQPAGRAPAAAADPACTDPDAVAAGRSTAGGRRYRAAPGAAGTVQVCFGAADRPGAGPYAVASAGDRRVSVLGQRAVLVNDSLAEEGNAALALRALGRQEDLVWLMANPLDGPAAQEPAGLLALRPGWTGPVAILLAAAVAVTITWRGRRLGRLVPEPLPVVVRSAETAVGRAALYRRAGARDRAAAVLRAASLRRLAAYAHLPPSAGAEQVVTRAAARSGRTGADVRALLLGPAPADDRALADLADALDTLERQARHL